MQLSYLLVTDLSFFCVVICILLILWNLLKPALGPVKGPFLVPVCLKGLCTVKLRESL